MSEHLDAFLSRTFTLRHAQRVWRWQAQTLGVGYSQRGCLLPTILLPFYLDSHMWVLGFP